ncbi:MAG TPA: hypothetical protein VM487_17245 [Phycisphaerae bacterium]|nr:hypothetical protein [Phycisphaerae bacterium]
MRKKLNRIATAAFVAFALAISACGGDDDGGGTAATTTDTGAVEAQGETPGNGDLATNAPRAPTPEQLAGCLEEGGYVATVIPAPPAGQPGAEFGSVGSVRLDLGAGNGVVAVFFEKAEDVKDLRDSALGARGQSEVLGKVYLWADRSRPQELGAFRSCLKG